MVWVAPLIIVIGSRIIVYEEFAKHRGLTENTIRPMLYGSNRFIMKESIAIDTESFISVE